jgi:hypothetical protein
MKTLLNLEEVALVALSIYVFAQMPFEWWVYLALFLVPDVGMIGYLGGSRLGS